MEEQQRPEFPLGSWHLWSSYSEGWYLRAHCARGRHWHFEDEVEVGPNRPAMICGREDVHWQCPHSPSPLTCTPDRSTLVEHHTLDESSRSGGHTVCLFPWNLKGSTHGFPGLGPLTVTQFCPPATKTRPSKIMIRMCSRNDTCLARGSSGRGRPPMRKRGRSTREAALSSPLSLSRLTCGCGTGPGEPTVTERLRQQTGCLAPKHHATKGRRRGLAIPLLPPMLFQPSSKVRYAAYQPRQWGIPFLLLPAHSTAHKQELVEKFVLLLWTRWCTFFERMECSATTTENTKA